MIRADLPMCTDSVWLHSLHKDGRSDHDNTVTSQHMVTSLYLDVVTRPQPDRDSTKLSSLDSLPVTDTRG